MFIRSRRRKPEIGMKAFFKDPFTYIGTAVSAAPTAAALLSGEKYDDLGEAMIASLVTGAGMGIQLYSVAKHLRPSLVLKKVMAEAGERRKQRRWWRNYRKMIRDLKEIDIPDEQYRRLVEEAQHLESDPKRALRIADKALNILNKYHPTEHVRKKIQAVAEQAPRKEPEAPEEKYAIAPRKAYAHLSDNQRLRAGYFLQDVEELVADQGARKELLNNIKQSKWYAKLTGDVQTYTFFDDMTLTLRRGEIPGHDKISTYLAAVYSE